MAEVAVLLDSAAFEHFELALVRRRFTDGMDATVEAARAELGIDWEWEYLDVIDADFARAARLRALAYSDYLSTEHWQTVRIGALERADHKCQLCSSPRRLQVHHRTYDFLGQESPDDVTVLCAGCHQLFHENRELER